MKRIILSACLLTASCSALHAQSTLTAATNNPVAGDVFYGHLADTAGVRAGAAGAGVTWNFSTLVQTDMDTTTFLACASTPFCDSFAGSNIVAYDGTGYLYGNTSASGLTFNGDVAGGTYTHFTDPKTFISYPLTYHTAYKDTTVTSFDGGGTMLYLTLIDSSVCDAYGSLTLPSGTYSSVLRVYTSEVTKDSVNFGGFPFVNETRTEMYQWYTAGFHYPLLSITYDTAGSSTGPRVTEAKYYSRNAAAVNHLSAGDASLSVFPNPAASAINARFTLTGTAAAAVTLTDVMGRVVRTIGSADLKTGANELSIPVAGLADGMYILQLHTATGTAAQKITIRK